MEDISFQFLQDVEYFVGLVSCLIQFLLFAAETGGREGALGFQINVTAPSG